MEELGRKLRETREERGIGLEEVQQHTKIRTRYLEAIEEGKLELLPGNVYAKGFIRSYAEYLGLDGQALLDEYNLVNETSKTAIDLPDPSTPPRKNISKKKPMINRAIWPQFAAGVGILVVIVAVYALVTKGASHSNETHVAKGSSAHMQANANSQQTKTPVNSSKQTQQKIEPPAPTVTLTQTQQTSTRRTYAVTNVKNLQLKVTASGQCWIQVTSDGKITYSGTLKQGMEQTWTASHSVALLAGNSPAIQMQLNEKPVDSANYTGGFTYTFLSK